ncbi:alpha/beta hydrolase [Rhodococcus sp. NPDC049939]|uniref:alpha/beta hydrolase n=1 Tax=Rhodococcus sp. NPDC049939 TaxID=3155511 RepID=UPI0033F8E42D
MSIGSRVPAALAGGFAIVLVAAACASGEQGTAERSAALPPGPVPAGLEKFYTQQVDWGSCDGYSKDGPPLGDHLDCAKVTVPNDYESPEGATAQIAISRSKATGDKVGSLLVNPGGPGASGLALASVAHGKDLADSFDVIGFDPRGVGASSPEVTCLTAAEMDAKRRLNDIDMSPAGIARIEDENRDYADKCAERTGVDVLAHVGTYDVVRDMDVIRAVLGDEKLNYLGFSYGTRLGSTYAETFPGNVRAMVLDGALDPEQDPTQEMILQAAGFQDAFNAFAAQCMQQQDCPLGNDPAQANARFRALVDPLISKPAATTDPRGLSYRDAITGVQQALYTPALWGPLRGGLESLESGTGDSLLMLADLYEGRSSDGTYSNLNDAFTAIRCVDDPAVTDRAEVGEADTRYRQMAPFLDDGRGTGNAPLDTCAFWPVPNTGYPHTIDAPGIPPVVVVSTTEDPATPYQAGVDLAKQMDGVLVTNRGTQHTVVLDGKVCIDDVVTDYLVNLAVPPADLTC